MRIEELMLEAVRRDASDLHLVAGVPATVRVDGVLTPLNGRLLEAGEAEGLLAPILTPEQRAELEAKRTLGFTHVLPDGSRFYVQAYHESGSVAVSARLRPSSVPALEQMGLPETLKQIAQTPHGLVIVTGPTGCGKSTTMFSMVEHINQNSPCLIFNIGDPPVYLMRPKKAVVCNITVGSDALSVEEALRTVIRQDPDVIVVGEVRNLDTIELCLGLAWTGHLVFAPLHANTAVDALGRMVNFFPADQRDSIRQGLADALAAVVAQRLIRRREGKGRLAAVEILIANLGVRHAIRENMLSALVSIMEADEDHLGMCTMEQSLARLAREGLVEPQEARGLAPDPQKFDKCLSG